VLPICSCPNPAERIDRPHVRHRAIEPVKGPPAPPTFLVHGFGACLPAAAAVGARPIASTTPLSARGGGVHSDERPLAQAMPVGARADAEGILALFDASEPTTVEERVAEAHGLAIISRLTLGPLGKRVVRFRIPDARSTMELVAELSADSRVSGAQPNFRYQMPDQSRIGGLRPRLEGVDKANRLAGRQRLDDGTTGTRRFAWQRRGSLVAGNQASLRWPTAGEPFVDLGVRNR